MRCSVGRSVGCSMGRAEARARDSHVITSIAEIPIPVEPSVFALLQRFCLAMADKQNVTKELATAMHWEEALQESARFSPSHRRLFCFNSDELHPTRCVCGLIGACRKGCPCRPRSLASVRIDFGPLHHGHGCLCSHGAIVCRVGVPAMGRKGPWVPTNVDEDLE